MRELREMLYVIFYIKEKEREGGGGGIVVNIEINNKELSSVSEPVPKISFSCVKLFCWL